MGHASSPIDAAYRWLVEMLDIHSDLPALRLIQKNPRATSKNNAM